jgi:predicted SAM-dependent methyltransferase
MVRGGNPRNQLKRLLNVPIRVFGRRQTRFNNELLDALAAVLTQMQSFYYHAEHQLQRESVAEHNQEHLQRLGATVETLLERQSEQDTRLAHGLATQSHLVETQRGQEAHLEQLAADMQSVDARLEQLIAEQERQNARLEQLATDQQGQHTRIAQLATDQQGQHTWVAQLATDQQGQHTWIAQLAADQQGQQEWIQLIQRKHEMLALDVREQTPALSKAAQALPEPRIVDPEAYGRLLADMHDRIRVNLGCGEKPLPGYLNVDLRELPDVDVVADAQRLPFEPSTLAELASAHLVEHFREHQLRRRILPYWKSLLRSDGALRIICPNWGAMLERLKDGRMSLADFKLLTFGAQDYEGDDHFAMYTPATLTSLLNDCGFARVDLVAAERMNGMCPEMELLGYL